MATKTKTPYYLHAPDEEILAFDGLFMVEKDHSKPEGDPNEWTLTATILTSDAAEDLVHIHDRNPFPLPRDWWNDWLNPELIGDQSFIDAVV